MLSSTDDITWVGLGVLCVSMWLGRARMIGDGVAPGWATAVTVTIALVGGIMALVLIYYLRSDTVRDAMVDG